MNEFSIRYRSKFLNECLMSNDSEEREKDEGISNLHTHITQGSLNCAFQLRKCEARGFIIANNVNIIIRYRVRITRVLDC